ncbi:MAG: hypothetical protein FJY36_06070 [Betaproteobacteria bacterium]|nr:hypothetical protein [Betaproteobacteria bacterium]
MKWPDLRTPSAGLALLLALLQGCSTPPTAFPGDGQPDRAMNRLPGKVRPEAAEAAMPAAMSATSSATSAQAYRQDAARHLYAQQAARIYSGRLPPMLYAVGALSMDIDRFGQVHQLRWLRAPTHAPEVMAEIEQMVRAAAPFPAPKHLDKVSYTDVWLWHKSGRFQLDTLTEGQD